MAQDDDTDEEKLIDILKFGWPFFFEFWAENFFAHFPANYNT